MKKKNNLGSKENPYCDNKQCTDLGCAKHPNYVPWKELVWVEKYTLDKNGVCKNKIE